MDGSGIRLNFCFFLTDFYLFTYSIEVLSFIRFVTRGIVSVVIMVVMVIEEGEDKGKGKGRGTMVRGC